MAKECAQCGASFSSTRTNAKYCSRKCRETWHSLLRGRTCNACGKRLAYSLTAAPQGEARCRECREAMRTTSPTCPDCGGTKSMTAAVCRPCRAKRQQIRADGDQGVVRHQRERSAPGIAPVERSRLLAKWKRRGVRCAYCPALANTIDHAVPLVRGGTNYEGNLVPCCRSCNSSKGGRLIIEMKAGRPARRMAKRVEWKPGPRPSAKIRAIKGEQQAWAACPECNSLHDRRSPFCSERCASRKLNREAYRRKVGIPIDAPLWGRSLR